MRVLLVSPIDPEVPGNLKFLMGGENTYTRTLLANSPEGVEYVHFVEALKGGEICYGQFYKFLSMLVKFRVLPLSAGTIDIELLGDFDLVHCHAFTLRLSGKGADKVPVVLGDSTPARWGLKAYFDQSSLRIKCSYIVRKIVHEALNICDQDLFLGDFSKLVVMSEFAKREHVNLGGYSKRIKVVYPGLSDNGKKTPRKNGKVRFLFAGVWFERKGGMVLWEAYKRLRKKFGKKVYLTILGPLPRKLRSEKSNLKSFGIEQHDFVPYSRLIGKYYPGADVLVHVSPKVEGYGMVVQEAMSFGVPSIVTRIGALPEMVIDGKTGLVIEPNNINVLVRAMERVVEDESLRMRLGKSARKRFLTQFSLPVMQKKLLEIYKEAIENKKNKNMSSKKQK